jgi:hypothetical protein
MAATNPPQLSLNRCPHCNVDRPLLTKLMDHKSTDFSGRYLRLWAVYQCSRCGGCILRGVGDTSGAEQYPKQQSADDEAIPTRARQYLDQAISSLHAPAGAVMLAASAVDAMLKAKEYKDGSLYTRINQAVTDHLITKDMGKWAHDVRLDANDQRHVDDKSDLPTEADAKRVVEFTKSLAMFLFVLPAMVTRGIKEAEQPKPKT